MKRINLGFEGDPFARRLAETIQKRFPADKIKIYKDGFIYNDIYVEFLDEKYRSLFMLEFGHFLPAR
jgi:hypothetical protein